MMKRSAIVRLRMFQHKLLDRTLETLTLSATYLLLCDAGYFHIKLSS